MYSLGIDLGGTNIVASVVDDQYNIISTAKTKTNAPRPANAIFDDVEKVCREAVREASSPWVTWWPWVWALPVPAMQTA